VGLLLSSGLRGSSANLERHAAGVLKALGQVVWTALFAAILTAVSGAVWSGLLLTNLKVRPDLPWAAAAMAAISLLLWLLIGSSRGASYRRANPVPPRKFILALVAGGACIVALAGLWIMFVELTRMPENSADFSKLPKVTLIASLVIAALVGGVFEEAGFRGYFQGTLERYMPWMLAVLVCALVMAPLHAATQGFAWPILVFYLLADFAFGTSAALTNSVLPGILVHTAGLFAFFAFIWPADKTRPMSFAAAGPDLWLWVHVVQIVVFGAIGIWLFSRLAGERRISN
jgi:membrane protease YdiL (CAAX protease family)